MSTVYVYDVDSAFTITLRDFENSWKEGIDQAACVLFAVCERGDSAPPSDADEALRAGSSQILIRYSAENSAERRMRVLMSA